MIYPLPLPRLRAIRALALFILLSISNLHAAPVISEFQASNSATLPDEDGDSSDWIEIFNPDGTVADLSGYYLTDDPALLTKWRFPATTTLAPSSFLLVFASDKDRAVAGSQLHTNFKLSSNGEYLALVAADGTTVVYEYAPEFPLQFEDSSYGLAQLGNTSNQTLIGLDASCTAQVPIQRQRWHELDGERIRRQLVDERDDRGRLRAQQRL